MRNRCFARVGMQIWLGEHTTPGAAAGAWGHCGGARGQGSDKLSRMQWGATSWHAAVPKQWRKGSNGTCHIQAGILPLVCPLPSLMLEAAPASSLRVHSSRLSRCMRTAVHCAASPWAEPFSACVWGRKEPGQTQELSSPPLAAGEPSAAWPCASSAGESVSKVLGQKQLFPD